MKHAWSSSGLVDLDNLKELAKKFRFYKSIPNFFRDYTTEDSLVAVLKRYVRNNAAFLSLTSSSPTRAHCLATQTSSGVPGAINHISYAIDSVTSIDGNGSIQDPIRAEYCIVMTENPSGSPRDKMSNNIAMGKLTTTQER